MKFIKWKSLIITCLVCLSPILLGIALWDKLPESIAIHFNFHGEPDNFASKSFAVFGLPFIMFAAQIIGCSVYDFNAEKHGEKSKFEKSVKWIIPVITVILYIVTLLYALGVNIDIRIVVVLFLLLLIPYIIYGIKNNKKSTQ